MYSRIIKRILDLIGATFGLLLLLPILLPAIIVLGFVNKGGIFFTQSRPGKDGRLFKIIKLKTMTDGKDEYGNLLPNHLRLTKTGKLLRKLSIDEIPQLLNVLKGDMSLVGPRPLLVEYLPLYNSRQRKRHLVRPGITGWAQVNGRNSISWEEKFEYDVYYVENISFLLDCKILLLTVRKVFLRDGVNQDEKVTMPRFQGNSGN